MNPASSIIIVTYNNIQQIDACLRALAALGSEPTYEIIVVDNGSEDGTADLVESSHPAVRVLRMAENLGFAGGVNCGVAAASGALIALLNPDATITPGWLAQLAGALAADPQIGVAGSKVLSQDGRLQSVGAVFDATTMLPVYRGEGEQDRGQYDGLADVWSVHGAAMAFPRLIWEQLAGFDAGFFPAYLEESDFCERVRRAGYRVVVAPQSVIYHSEAASTGKASAQFYFYFLRNRLRYMVKWSDWSLIWQVFRPAEHARLRQAPLLDRRVARLVYAAGIPALGDLSAEQRATVLRGGSALLAESLRADGLQELIDLAGEAEASSVHTETRFHSRYPLVARARTVWNSIATRWYVRPNLDQQTRYNLALQRALLRLIDQTSSSAAATALDAALLAQWQLRGGGVEELGPGQ